MPTKRKLPRYMMERGRILYAVMEIPKPLRPVIGRQRFLVSLETEVLSVAERLLRKHLDVWRKQIAAAKGHPPEDDAAYWRGRLLKAKTDKERALIREEIDHAAWDIGAATIEHIGQAPSGSPEAQRFHAAATGQLTPFTEHLDAWLAASSATAKTRDMQKADVKRFAAKFANVQDATRPEVRRWVDGLMTDGGLTPKTVQRILSAIRGYWRYLQNIGVADEEAEPFDKLDVARRAKARAPKAARQPFEPSDVVKLLNAAVADDDDELADLIRLGMWSGCRIEELCALRIERVKDDHFSVTDAKTAAGWRDVPIHASLQQTMARLIGDRKSGYVLADLTENKYGDRSNAIGKRFGRLKADMGFGPQFVFHSIRKTVSTLLDNAGVPENVAADILGHDKPTMTYGLYSGGSSLAVKKEALAKLAY